MNKKCFAFFLLITHLTMLSTLTLAKNETFNKHTKATRYPIVLVHGTLGFDQWHGVDYFYGITRALSKTKSAVYTVTLSPIHSNEFRGEELLSQLETILAISQAEKVNIIGHSQGASTGRYVMAVRPEIVASLTSVHGAHFGSPVADLIGSQFAVGFDAQLISNLGLYLQQISTLFESHDRKQLKAAKKQVKKQTKTHRKNPIASDNAPVPGFIVAQSLLDLGQLIGTQSKALDVSLALGSLMTQGAHAFNEKFPTGLPATPCEQGAATIDGIYLFSWSGHTARTREFDPTDNLMAELSGAFARDSEHDGLVERCSSHFGLVIRDDYPLNHFDAINQVLGFAIKSPINVKQLYRNHISRLKALGL